MSQQRMRKVSVVGGDTGGSCARVSVTKASGDSVCCDIGAKQQRQRSSSKNKILKSVRYDLETTLISLCDLWFEDIKPHLIRNNIKLHVHGSGRGSGSGYPGSASGDHGRVAVGSPGCSHLDPGAASDQRQRGDASCADCYSTLRTASKVRSHKRRTRQRLSPASPAPPHSSLEIPLAHATPSNRRGCNGKPIPRSRKNNQEPRSSPPPSQSNWRVPRLCRIPTVSSATCRTETQIPRVLQPEDMPVPRRGDFYQFIQPKRKVKMKHKSTQTEHILRVPEPMIRHRVTSVMPFGPCPGTTIIPHRRRNPERSRHKSHSNSKPLFSDDLVNIIAEKHDKKLSLLYGSPQRENSPSVMNLIQSSDVRSKQSTSVGKKKSWR